MKKRITRRLQLKKTTITALQNFDATELEVARGGIVTEACTTSQGCPRTNISLCLTCTVY